VNEILNRYADLLVSAVNVREGQTLLIKGEPVLHEVFASLASAAYRRGAKHVGILVESAAMRAARVNYAKEDYLDLWPEAEADMLERFVEEGWALLSLKSPDDPDILSDADEMRIGRLTKAMRTARKPFSQALQSDRCAWCVSVPPTAGWARKVLGDPNLGETEAIDQMWGLLMPLFRLDSENPGATWERRGELLRRRGQALDRLRIEELHFTGPGTDLRIGLTTKSIWAGGPAETPDGTVFLPNLPTEENFTTPHKDKVQGRVRVTRPVVVAEKLVEGAWFQFEDGRVTDFGADRNEEALTSFFKVDKGARRVGEVALVDSDSPVARSSRVFFNTLLDENAACHIALGSSYPFCLDGGRDMSEEELGAVGANRSAMHSDFMIGGDDVRVSARAADGREIVIIEDGSFRIDGSR
jgi:aminopeptidase